MPNHHLHEQHVTADVRLWYGMVWYGLEVHVRQQLLTATIHACTHVIHKRHATAVASHVPSNPMPMAAAVWVGMYSCARACVCTRVRTTIAQKGTCLRT